MRPRSGENFLEGAARASESRSGPERLLPPTAADLGLSRKDIYDARLVRDAEQADRKRARRSDRLRAQAHPHDLLTDLLARHPELLLFSLVCAGLRGAKRSANKGNCRTRLLLYRGRGTHRKGTG